MSDYVSKYTGSEVDGILDEAIELPEATSDDNGKFLRYDSGSVIWDSLPEGLPVHDNNEYRNSILTINNRGTVNWHVPGLGAPTGQYLKYSSTSGIIWDAAPGIDTTNAFNGQYLKYSSSTGIMWDSVPSINTTNAHNGEFLKYSSSTGIMWDNPSGIDTSAANDGEYLKYSSGSGTIWGNPIDTSAASTGDFLRYGNNGLEWNNPIDTSDANDGDFLKYSSEAGIMWDTVISTSDANDGEVLKYSSAYGFYWDAPIDTSGANDGDVLKYASNTGLVWGTVGAIPECDSSELALLTSDCGSVGWIDLSDIGILPTYDTSYDSSDTGKILTVLNNGSLGWVLPDQ